MGIAKKIFRGLLVLVTAACSVGALGVLALSLALTLENPESVTGGKAADVAIMDRYDMYMTNRISSALEGVLAIEKVYWLRDDDLVAPEPDQKKFGSTKDPTELEWLLEAAKPLLDGQDTIFSTDVKLPFNSEVRYYLDDTIMAITWKEVRNGCVYTFSEVKIAHPSQLRRFLAGGSFASPIQLTTSEMAASVNAVVASSGDFYMFRRHGVIVYDGVVQRCNDDWIETCYIDEDSNLLFSRKGQFGSVEAAQRFVDENNIRFSMAFGPILIENGEPAKIQSYILGEIYDRYSRAAIGQKGPLHYLFAVTSIEQQYYGKETVFDFQRQLMTLGLEQAYALDGGQTAVIVMNDQVINRVVYGYQRDISDIVYFATAIPD